MDSFYNKGNKQVLLETIHQYFSYSLVGCLDLKFLEPYNKDYQQKCESIIRRNLYYVRTQNLRFWFLCLQSKPKCLQVLNLYERDLIWNDWDIESPEQFIPGHWLWTSLSSKSLHHELHNTNQQIFNSLPWQFLAH